MKHVTSAGITRPPEFDLSRDGRLDSQAKACRDVCARVGGLRLLPAAKQGFSLAEPMTLLLLSGLISMVTALCAYRVGRGLPFVRLMEADGARRIGWVLAWIGFVYGVQLSLLVLSLLWLVGYDYAKHPDGPAMMALIIPTTAVARDAFEIGYIRWLESAGRPLVTFPDGAQLRTLLQRWDPALLCWVGAGALACATLSVAMATAVSGDLAVLAQGAIVTVAAGTVALCAFFVGQAGGDALVVQAVSHSLE